MPHRFTYSIFMIAAAVVFLSARLYAPRSAGPRIHPWWKQGALLLAVFIGGTLGAKLPFAFVSGEPWYTRSAWFNDGKTIMTGLVFAYLAVELMKIALGIRVKTGDSFALPLALALAVGRWGCFFNGCCYGTPTSLPWGVDFGDGILRHPTQVYESLFHFMMAMVLLQLIVSDGLRYQRLKLYLIAYAAFRFATEYIRPAPTVLWSMTFYQWVALAFAAFLAFQWVMDERRKRYEGKITAQFVD